MRIRGRWGVARSTDEVIGPGQLDTECLFKRSIVHEVCSRSGAGLMGEILVFTVHSLTRRLCM
jgi:hypothetical protein